MQNLDQSQTQPQEEVQKEGDTQLDKTLHLENLINGYLVDLESTQEEYQDQNNMLKDLLQNDAEYAEQAEKVKEERRKLKERKDQIMKDPSAAVLDEKVRNLRQEVKELKQGLSDYLQQFYQQSGMNQITASDGEVREIVTTVKLVKKK